MSIGQPARGPCVVWGGYGYGNTGDDLVLSVALADLRKQHGENLVILSPDPAQTLISLCGTNVILHPASRPQRAIERWFWRWTDYAEQGGMRTLADTLYRAALNHPERFAGEPAWLEALGTASSLHLTGGGYLADRFDLRHFLRPLRLARSRRLPVSTSPLGLGPFRNHRKGAAVAAALRGAKLAVRDEDSLRFCLAHQLAAVELPDDGFRWRKVIDLPATSPAATAAIGVCIFAQYSPLWSDRVEAWWVACLQSLSRALPSHRLEGFCFHTGLAMDYETTRRIFVRAGFNPDQVQSPQSDFRAAVKNLARYQAILSTRFHAVVTASEMRLPCVATAMDDYYEAKMRGALKHAPTPLTILNPLRDPPDAAARWLAPQLQLPTDSTTAGLRTAS